MDIPDHKTPYSYNPLRERIGLAIRHLLGRANYQRIALLFHGMQYSPIQQYVYIDGWLAHLEAATLYDTALSLESDKPVVCEIGSWLGRSTVVIGKALLEKTGAQLYCIDPFDASGDEDSEADYAARKAKSEQPLFDRFMANITQNGLTDVVHPIKAFSYEARKHFDTPVDMLFIDGDHSYDGVRRDFDEWTPLIKPGGWLAFHDVSFNNTETGPQQVIRESISDRNEWTDSQLIQSLFLCRKACQ